MQHPESQVLGTRVADDVVWGLPPGTDDRRRPAARRGRPRRPGRTRHRRPVRRRAAAAGRGRGAGARAVAADRRRGHQHGRPAGPRRTDGRAVRADRASSNVVGAHHALQRRGRLRRPRHQPHRAGGTADNIEMVETAAAPRRDGRRPAARRRAGARTRSASATSTAAEHRGRQRRCATSTSSSTRATAC